MNPLGITAITLIVIFALVMLDMISTANKYAQECPTTKLLKKKYPNEAKKFKIESLIAVMSLFSLVIVTMMLGYGMFHGKMPTL